MTSQASTRVGFMKGFEAIAALDQRLMLVCADSVKAMRADAWAREHPDRVIDVGIAEQHATALSAGLAIGGFIPYFATYACFITMRACEQIRSFIAYPELDVKLVGINGGIAAGEREGVTHQSFEDIGILRTIPNITILVPADAGQARQAAVAAASIHGPVYIRLGSGRDPIVFEDDEPFVAGPIHVLRKAGHDVALFGNGVLLPRLLAAADELAARGFGATVVEVHTVKPLDTDGVIGILRECGAAVTAEDHTINGGLGSAITETAAESFPVPITRIGLRDRFPSSGLPDALLDRYGMGVEAIVDAAMATIARKAVRA